VYKFSPAKKGMGFLLQQTVPKQASEYKEWPCKTKRNKDKASRKTGRGNAWRYGREGHCRIEGKAGEGYGMREEIEKRNWNQKEAQAKVSF
jgi:hypothetical protein